MKKLLLLSAFCVAGLVSAASTSESNVTKEDALKSELLLKRRPGIEQGLGIIDTADGSCVVYGTYYTGDNGDSIFVVGSNATNATMGLPKCSGAGNYQA